MGLEDSNDPLRNNKVIPPVAKKAFEMVHRWEEPCPAAIATRKRRTDPFPRHIWMGVTVPVLV